MTALAQDRPSKKVLYVVKSVAVARKVRQDAKDAGIGSKVEYIKLRDRNKQPFTGKMWRL